MEYRLRGYDTLRNIGLGVMKKCTYSCTNLCINVYVYIFKYICTFSCMCVNINVCTYVHIHVFVYIFPFLQFLKSPSAGFSILKVPARCLTHKVPVHHFLNSQSPRPVFPKSWKCPFPQTALWHPGRGGAGTWPKWALKSSRRAASGTASSIGTSSSSRACLISKRWVFFLLLGVQLTNWLH